MSADGEVVASFTRVRWDSWCHHETSVCLTDNVLLRGLATVNPLGAKLWPRTHMATRGLKASCLCPYENLEYSFWEESGQLESEASL